MKDIFESLIELYTIKLTNYVIIMDATTFAHAIDDMSDYEPIQIGKLAQMKDFEYNHALAQRFLIPVIHTYLHPGHKNKGKQPQCCYHDELVALLQWATKENIIQKVPDPHIKTYQSFNIVVADHKRYKNEVLTKIKLPCYISTDRKKGEIDYSCIGQYSEGNGMLFNVDIFHSLTGCDLPHLVREQIEQVRNEPRIDPYPVFKDGVIYNSNVLRGALVKLRYYRFTTPDEITAAVGTNGMELAQQIANRMFERVKK